MKTKILIITLLLISTISYSQTPSINENKRFLKSDDSFLIQQNINEMSFKCYTLDCETKEAEKILNDSVSTKENKEKSQKKIEENNIEKDNLMAKIESEKEKKISEYDSFEKVFTAKIEKANSDLVSLKKDLSNLTDIDKMDTKLLEIRKKEKEINTIKNERYTKLKSLSYSFFLPTLNKKYRKEFFEATYNNDIKKTSYLNSISLSGDKNGAVAQSEIITDNISAFRISFGTVLIANSSNTTTQNDSISKSDVANEVKETENDAFKRLINGGGNFYTELLFPLLTTYDDNVTDLFTSYTYASFKGAMDIKGFGNNIETSTGNGSFGINSYVGISSDSKKFNFFVQGNINYGFGSSAFYKNLGLKNEQGFLNGKIITGVTLLNIFKITAIINAFGSDEKLRNGKVQVGVQVLPGF